MANTYIRARSPKGNVGVTDVVDAGELSAYSAGVLSGFTAKSAASWTLQIGGVSGVQDVAIAKNPSGESELFSGTAGQSIPFIIGGAPGTPGQSRTDALVIYKDPFTTSVVNNGVDVTDYQVVAGTAATTGSQVPPNDAAIRSAIPSGTLKFVAVIGYVTTAYGASGTTTGAYTVNQSQLNYILSRDSSGASKAIVLTSETLNTATYTKLTTTTDQVTVTVGASGKVWISAKALSANNAVAYNYIAVALTGANTLTALAAETAGYAVQQVMAASSNLGTLQTNFLMTGLTPGVTTFSMYYKSDGVNIASFQKRILSVIPL